MPSFLIKDQCPIMVLAREEAIPTKPPPTLSVYSTDTLLIIPNTQFQTGR